MYFFANNTQNLQKFMGAEFLASSEISVEDSLLSFQPPFHLTKINGANTTMPSFALAFASTPSTGKKSSKVDTYIRSGIVIGLGSGHASCLAIQYLGQQLRAGKIKDIVGIPASVGSASEAAKAGILLD